MITYKPGDIIEWRTQAGWKSTGRILEDVGDHVRVEKVNPNDPLNKPPRYTIHKTKIILVVDLPEVKPQDDPL